MAIKYYRYYCRIHRVPSSSGARVIIDNSIGLLIPNVPRNRRNNNINNKKNLWRPSPSYPGGRTSEEQDGGSGRDDGSVGQHARRIYERARWSAKQTAGSRVFFIRACMYVYRRTRPKTRGCFSDVGGKVVVRGLGKAKTNIGPGKRSCLMFPGDVTEESQQFSWRPPANFAARRNRFTN